MQGTDYQECLLNAELPIIKQYLVNIKSVCNITDKETAVESAEYALDTLDKKVENYLAAIEPLKSEISTLTADVKDFLNSLAYKIIRQSIAKEYNG